MPPYSTPPRRLIDRRHAEWEAGRHTWRWLVDSYRGGDTYRYATHGTEQIGGVAGVVLPKRNLIRYKLEVPDVSRGEREHPDYQIRLERTPVPSLVPEAVETHLAEIYDQEVTREHPNARLSDWWEDVDGANTSIDEWMSDEVAPLLMSLGFLDLAFDRPRVPDGVDVLTDADVERLGLNRCIARYVLPWNMLWWDRDPVTRRYNECLILGQGDPDALDRDSRLWHWTDEQWTLYDGTGDVLASDQHPYGRVPIIRVFDRIDPRKEHVGISRYEVVAEIQREVYNKESEIVLSNARHSYPVLQAPEDMLDADGQIAWAPGQVARMQRNTMSGDYVGLSFIEPPQGPSDSLRKDQERMRDAADRAAKLTKPAGAQGTTGGTVSQSGISKSLDQKSGNRLLSRIARTLQKVEWEANDYALAVLLGRDTTPAERDAIKIVYPTDFDLLSPEEFAGLVAEFQALVAETGHLPRIEAAMLQAMVRRVLEGRDERDYEVFDREIEAFVAEQAERKKEMAENAAAGIAQSAMNAGADEDEDEGEDTKPEPESEDVNANPFES